MAELLPRWSGDALDLVVDFTTYVFVPAYAMVASGICHWRVGLPLGFAIVVTGALYFADGNMKTADNYFRGFPAVWNADRVPPVAAQAAAVVAAAIVAVLAVLTFVPVKFVHPFRVRRLRRCHIACSRLWAILGLVALLHNLAPGLVGHRWAVCRSRFIFSSSACCRTAVIIR